MAKYLILGGANSSTWRLPAEADPKMLGELITDAVKRESILVVEVELNDDPRSRVQLNVNGRALSHWAVVEQSEQ